MSDYSHTMHARNSSSLHRQSSPSRGTSSFEGGGDNHLRHGNAEGAPSRGKWTFHEILGLVVHNRNCATCTEFSLHTGKGAALEMDDYKKATQRRESYLTSAGLRELEAHNSQLRSEKKLLCNQLDSLKRDHNELKKDYEDLEHSYESARDDIADLSKE
ncbi:hypothetical protein V5O48_019572, partial [Marasmius crinis-equi]